MESSKISVKRVEEIWPATEDFPTRPQPAPSTLKEELLAARQRLEQAKASLRQPDKVLTDADREFLRRLEEVLAEIDALLEGRV